MAKQQIEIPHTLSPDEVRSRLTAASGKLEERYGARSAWQGPRELKVWRSGLDARVHVTDTHLRIELELGLVLRAFREKITNGITRELAAILDRPAPPAPST